MAVTEDLKEQEETSPRPEKKKQKPQLWKWSVIFLCLYGFMAQLKPGDSFITPLLLSLEKNFTREEITGLGIVLPSRVPFAVNAKCDFFTRLVSKVNDFESCPDNMDLLHLSHCVGKAL